MAETDTASAITFTTSTAVTIPIAPATEQGTAGQVFNPLHAQWVDDPLILPGAPVTNSVVRFETATPAGSTATVETSINNGASWEPATNNRPVPRLNPGDTTTRQILTRVTFTRTNPGDPTPRLLMLDVQVTCDASIDELVPIGHGIITKTAAKLGQSSLGRGGGPGVTVTGGGMTGTGLHLTVKAVDPSRAIAKNPWEKPKIIASQPYEQAAVEMVADRLPTQEDFSVSTTGRTTELLIYGVDQATDSWQDIRELATACGYEAFFDTAGTFVFTPVTDPRIARPVWVFDDSETCTVTQAERELTDDQTLNHVVVKGESTSSQNAVSAVALDDDPSSPTYVYGRFGQHSVTVTIPAVTTEDQAQAAADAILHAALGAAETATITSVPIPFLECGDCVEVNLADIKADGRYVINQITMPIAPGAAMTLTCFRQSSTE